MIQDIKPSLFHVEYPPREPLADDCVIMIRDGSILLDGASYPAVGKMLSLCPCLSAADLTYLFRIDERSGFLVPHTFRLPETALAGGLSMVPLRALRSLRPMKLAFAGYTAAHLASWYESTRFCGRCGSAMIPGTDERKLVCPSCGLQVYPRINPAVIVAVYDKDRLLMTRYKTGGVGWFVLIAGFVEIGESAEDTVRREVMEEAGVRVRNIRYFGSQPWGIPGNLTLGYTAELDGSDELTVDPTELSDGRWFVREEVPLPDDEVSITSEMIHAFAAGRF